jgi:archaellum component FlaC
LFYNCRNHICDAAINSAATSQTEAETLGRSPHIAALAERVKELMETVKILTSQIQTLRSEVKKMKRISEQDFSIS